MIDAHRFTRVHGLGLLLLSVTAWGVVGCASSEAASTSVPASEPGPSGAVCPDTPPTYAGTIREFFGTYCVRCHSSTREGSERHGAPKWANLDTLEGVQDTSVELLDQFAAAGPLQENAFMPPGGSMPSTAERQALGEWLACGLP